jgi:hypothetical protein
MVLLDGAVRDRCPYVGDQAVSGLTLLVSHPEDAPVLHDMIAWYAANQHSDGSIPASPSFGGILDLFDYNAYWVDDLYDYVLYTGDLSLARQVWPNLVELMDDWYPAQMGGSRLLVNSGGDLDYGSIPRRGQTVAYYNAGYARALDLAASIATWLGQPTAASVWLERIDHRGVQPGVLGPLSVRSRTRPTGRSCILRTGPVYVLEGLATRLAGPRSHTS